MALLRYTSALASALIAVAAAGEPGWTTCGGLESAYNNTACPPTATCAIQRWMPSAGNWGCCPYADGVSCGNYTCCPKGTACSNTGSGWAVTSSCVDVQGNIAPPGSVGGGLQVCKTGGPLPLSLTKPNVIILGDSVSIGYYPKVAALMADNALVQHSPWGGDGGAEETRYGWECLEFLLAAPDGTPQRPDVLYFNFGLHNLGNDTVPGQSGPVSEYAEYLDRITGRLVKLLSPTTRLLFGITTPEMCDASLDAVVRSNNNAAVAIMRKHAVPTVDLHAAIVGQCGTSPNQKCFNQSTCFCPHCPQSDGIGYEFLAEHVIVPAISKLLPPRAAVEEGVGSD